jgi:hypothetical protein
LCLIVAAAYANGQDPVPDEGSIKGEAWFGETGIQEATCLIMERQKAHRASPHPTRIHPLHRRPVSTGAVGTSSESSADSSNNTPVPLGAQKVSPTINFTAATFSDTSGFPPDTMGTAGPTQFIIALNGRIRSFNKATGIVDGAIDTDSDVFFNSVMTPGPNFTTDPHIRYDRTSGRWFITMVDAPNNGTQANRVLIAVSDSADITSTTVWTFFQFRHDQVGTTPNLDTGNFADFPTLGIDANALYIGVNVFGTTDNFVNCTAFVVRKSSLLSGGPIQVTPFRSLISGTTGPFTAQGVDNFDPVATEGYFIGANFSGNSQLQLRRVSNPGGVGVSLSGNIGMSVSPWKPPPDVAAESSSKLIDAGDVRLLSAHFRNGYLWTTHNVGVNGTGGTSSPDRTGVRWYKIGGIRTGQTPSVAQSGTVFQPASAGTLSYWMGTIMVSGQGHAAMGFTAAGPTSFLNASTAGRLASDPLGTMSTPVNYTASAARYSPSDPANPLRWGDFSYTSLDPSDDMTMWTIQEWCKTSGNGYAVQVAKLLAPPPATPVSCTPNAVTQGVSSVSVAIKGSPVNGSGFFEPGASFSNHLALVIKGGGVSVTSIAYSNPSNFTAVLTVAIDAVPGARTITVTNPDGQSMTSASTLLNIISAPNTAPTLAPILSQTMPVGTTLTLTNSATDSQSPSQVLTFSLGSGAATNASINSNTGVFSWTPTAAQIGTNLFKVVVTDNGTPPLSATQSFAVVVFQTNHPPVLAAIPDRTLHALMTLTLTNTATDPDMPQQTLTFSLDPGAPAGASIVRTNGLFSWIPADTQVGLHDITVRVIDNGQPSLSDAKSFIVTVLPRPLLHATPLGKELVTLNWSSLAGTSYRVLSTTNLAGATWTAPAPDIVATGPVAGLTVTNSSVETLYRVVVVQ